MLHIKTCLILLLFIISFSCKDNTSKEELPNPEIKASKLKYAKGFMFEDYSNYKVLTIKNPWPEAKKTYKYLFLCSD